MVVPGEMSAAEMARAIDRLEAAQGAFVSKEVHEAIISGLREDILELKNTMNKMVWAVLALFVGIVSQVVVAIATRGSIIP